MKMGEIMVRAKELNIKGFGMKRDELIRSIQRAEGNFDCFGTAADGYCDQEACSYRALCLNGEAKAEADTAAKPEAKPKAARKK